jgi:biopolymer transport protein TolR
MGMSPMADKKRTRHSRHVMSEINVTPFVDVMLVLLIIFMVTAPLMTVGVPVDLPKANAPSISDDTEPLTISVDKKGVIYIQETEVDLDSIVPRLKAITGVNPEARIFVRGDQGLSYGRIMEVMGTVNLAGYRKVALLTEMPKPKPKA